MTAAVRAILAPVYWLACVVAWLAVMPLLAVPLEMLHGWQQTAADIGTGAVQCAAAVAAKGPILDLCARYVAGLIENLAAAWRELTAAPTLPPPGGNPTDGPAGPPSERIHP